MKEKTARKERMLYREFKQEIAKSHGVYNGERQLFSTTPKPAFCTRYTLDTNPTVDRVLRTFDLLQHAFNLRGIVAEDYKLGQIDVSYVDKDENAKIVYLEECEGFVEKYNELRSYGIAPIHGIRWDGQASPVFICLADLPAVLGRDEKTRVPIIPSGSASAGVTSRISYRYIQLGVYFWINGVLYDDYAEFEAHDGVLYPVIAFPDLPKKDGIKANEPVTLVRKKRPQTESA